ncbi:FAD-dependent oxidoreductase [Thiospirillum jenense]|uniref:FAD-dependent oxidoreductase n=1 Tax=Thiospirillum jenense TaxID=1653858 RepID=A0A839HBQ4_9GAMM|nr:FAD-dependent oxidoreductase [Thiospirillum jenense]
MHRITVVGSGFAALTALRTLRQASADLELTLVSPTAEFVYLPGLIWIPSGLRTGDDLRIDLRPFFERLRIRHIAASATGLRDNGRVLDTTLGPVRNDALFIASGGRFIKKLPGIEHAITPCEGIASAEAIRDRLKTMNGGTVAMGFAGNPNEPAAMRGGPIFEFLFGLDQQLRAEKRRDQFRLVFFTPAERPGNRLGPKAVGLLLAEMTRLGIDAHVGHKLKGFTPTAILTENGDVPADLIIFMPGLTGNAWFDQTELPRSPGGLLQADQYGRVVGCERIYVAGDAGSFPGPDWMPRQAHMADLQAQAAAHNLLAELDHQAPNKTFRVELLCIVDANDHGFLIARNERHNVVLPSSRAFHWLKRFYEWNYLRQYR